MKDKQKKDKGLHPQTEEVNQTRQQSNQRGMTDMESETVSTGRTAEPERGSGVSTKRNVTGSDYDGQVTP